MSKVYVYLCLSSAPPIFPPLLCQNLVAPALLVPPCCLNQKSLNSKPASNPGFEIEVRCLLTISGLGGGTKLWCHAGGKENRAGEEQAHFTASTRSWQARNGQSVLSNPGMRHSSCTSLHSLSSSIYYPVLCLIHLHSAVNMQVPTFLWCFINSSKYYCYYC